MENNGIAGCLQVAHVKVNKIISISCNKVAFYLILRTAYENGLQCINNYQYYLIIAYILPVLQRR